MYFMVNTAFVSYFDNLTDSLKASILVNRTTFEHTLPIFTPPEFDPKLITTPKTLKDFVHCI